MKINILGNCSAPLLIICVLRLQSDYLHFTLNGASKINSRVSITHVLQELLLKYIISDRFSPLRKWMYVALFSVGLVKISINSTENFKKKLYFVNIPYIYKTIGLVRYCSIA